jgi:DNA-binding protein YbaB
MPSSFDGLDDVQQSVDRLREDFEQLRKELAEKRFTGASDDELVNAVVTYDRDLVEVRIDPRVYRRPDSERLGVSIVEAFKRATQAASDESSAHLQARMGTRLKDLAHVRESSVSGGSAELIRRWRR